MLRSVQAKRGSQSAAAALMACLLALSLSAASAESAAAASCAGAAAQAAGASPGKLRAALLCLVNRKREAGGLRALKRDMVRNHYFAHQRPGGPDLTERLRRAGWHGHAWGETIAYGCDSMSTPRATLRMWMHSPPHRAILLSGAYRNGGLGVTDSAPCGRGSIWVLDVGRR
jgi:uncharacterized protein YkwD